MNTCAFEHSAGRLSGDECVRVAVDAAAAANDARFIVYYIYTHWFVLCCA